MNNIKETTIEAFKQMRKLNREKILNFIKRRWRYIIMFVIGIAYMSLLIEYSYSLRMQNISSL